MVKTRHSEQGFPPDFLSAEDNTLNNHVSEITKDRDADSKPVKSYRGTRQAYNLDDSIEKVEIGSRLRPRTGPSHAYNYLDEDSSDEDSYRRRRKAQLLSMSPRRRSHYKSRLIKQEMLDERKETMQSRLRVRRRSQLDESQDSQESEDDTTMMSLSRRSMRARRLDCNGNSQVEKFSRHSSKARRPETEDEDTVEEESLVRRSSRSRKQTFKLDQLKPKEKTLSQRDDDKLQQTKNKDMDTDDPDVDDEQLKDFSDMYSRVKRKRIKIKRNMYGIPIHSDSEEDQSRNNSRTVNEDEEESEDEEEEQEEEEEEEILNTRTLRRRPKKSNTPLRRQYSLREHKPRTELYKAPIEEKRRRIEHSVFAATPTKKSTNRTYQSPAMRSRPKKRKAHHSSSTSSSPSGNSSDEEKFQRRKSKSMMKARSKMMPMNYTNDSKPSGIIKDRIKSGASMADVEPMTIDRSVTFDSVGGLGKHVRALKEMVVFPLLYDKVFKRFKVDPPKGVLFYGPPGVGKTLVARALANECSTGEKKVSFFMRKGADCLSKWVGESERQLRLLFDQAYKYRPSIIFFDEIDGLAPVRSSRQDQIHSSIVSTLLALMDGLDSRGEIVVIGATNRIDSLDPALRRPGRFDREFLFPLPSFEARKQILSIQTACWQPKLNDAFLSQLAEKCVGYCGADLKALCTEAAMHALRRRYPQIYLSDEALEIDESSINVSAKDFFDAIQTIIPTSQRAVNTPAKPLSQRICPLMEHLLDDVMGQLNDIFPMSLAQVNSLNAAATSNQAQALLENENFFEELESDDDIDLPSIYVTPAQKGSKALRKSLGEGTSKECAPVFLNFISSSRQSTFRPRMMLVGKAGQGQTTYIGPAVIHKMESLPVHVLDLPTLYAVTAKTPEESVANIFHEAKRKCPSIVYIPRMDKLWNVMAQCETLKSIFLTQLQTIDPTLPLLLLATSDQPFSRLDPEVQCLFNEYSEVATMTNPGSTERYAFFEDLLLKQACKAPPQKKQAVSLCVERTATRKKKLKLCPQKNRNHSANNYHWGHNYFLNNRNLSNNSCHAHRMLEVLPKAAPIKPRELTKEELSQLEEKEELTLMELRIFLRDVLSKLGSDRKFSIFTKPVDIEDAPDYLDVIEHPMDLSTMMAKIDLHEYNTVAEFSADIDLVCENALEYNPNRGPTDKIIRHRACSLRDTAYAIIKTELDKDFEKACVAILESRARRGRKAQEPKFYRTKDPDRHNNSQSSTSLPSYLENPKPVRTIPEPEGERFSKRVRGLTIEPAPSLETIEKRYNRSSPVKEDCNKSIESDSVTPAQSKVTASKDSEIKQSVEDSDKSTSRPKLNAKSSSVSTTKKKPKNKCVWCKPKRKRSRLMFSRHQREKKDSDGDNQASSDEENEMDVSKDTTLDLSKDEKKPEGETPIPTGVNLELKIDTNTEPKESKPASRVSSRLRSTPLSSPIGVTTRRSSISPRLEATSVSKVKSLPNPSELEAVTEKETKLDDINGTEVFSNAGSILSSIQNEIHDSTLDVPTTGVTFDPKPSVVKRLDLDTVMLDSGVGSSLESNGDSRDSLEHHVKEGADKLTKKETKDETNENNNAKKKARALLKEKTQELVVDKGKLICLLDSLVEKTNNFYVERLDKIQVSLSQVIFRHRTHYDRTAMIQELEQRIEDLTKPISSRSSLF